MRFQVSIPHEQTSIRGELFIPAQPKAKVLVLNSPKPLVQFFQTMNFETLSVELDENEQSLNALLVTVLNWYRKRVEDKNLLPINVFSTQQLAAPVVNLGNREGRDLHGIAIWNGRFDAVRSSLSNLRVPTLLMTEEGDPLLLQMNQKILDQLHCIKDLEIIPGTNHQLENPITLEAVVHMSIDWFLRQKDITPLKVVG